MRRIIAFVIAFATLSALFYREAQAEAPSAEVAKKCLHFAYIAYPYLRPGAAPASGDRQVYFKACLEKGGNIPKPVRPKP